MDHDRIRKAWSGAHDIIASVAWLTSEFAVWTDDHHTLDPGVGNSWCHKSCESRQGTCLGITHTCEVEDVA